MSQVSPTPMSGQQMVQGGYVQNPSGFAQPAQQNTTVIVNQPTSHYYNPMHPHPLRPWSTGLCGCFEDCGNCLFASFCPLCYSCTVASKQGESCWGPLCVQGWLMVFRAHIRGVHSIEGSICNDCCVATFCGMCALCQVGRELDNIAKGSPLAQPADNRR